MRHFAFLTDDERQSLFLAQPQDFTRDSESNRLAIALGATLYSPATRPELTRDITKQAAHGVTSMVICLEDAVPHTAVPEAENNAIAQLQALHASGEEPPLLFVRVRTPEQIVDLARRLGAAAELLAGFVLPKFSGAVGEKFLDAVAKASADSGVRLLGMPVLESGDIIHRETRVEALGKVRELLDERREHVLAVRVGAADLSAAYGLRRPRGMPVYEIRVVADALADIVNVLGRADGTGYTVTGPVWEYFDRSERIFEDGLREDAFEDSRRTREAYLEIINRDLGGLLREIELDKANGLSGKTIIHPSHVAPVHAMSVVTHEEYTDACDIAAATDGGVMASNYANKMNEANPHRAWAERTLLRAEVFGVARPEVSAVDVMAACMAASDAW